MLSKREQKRPEGRNTKKKREARRAAEHNLNPSENKRKPYELVHVQGKMYIHW
jgi:hypothetical protein